MSRHGIKPNPFWSFLSPSLLSAAIPLEWIVNPDEIKPHGPSRIPSRSAGSADEEIEQVFMIPRRQRLHTLPDDLRYYFHRGRESTEQLGARSVTTARTSSLFNEISPSASLLRCISFFSLFLPPFSSLFFFPCVYSYFPRSFSLPIALALSHFRRRFRAPSFPNIFARIDEESQPAGKYTSLLNKTLSGPGVECTARINGRESALAWRGCIWEKCRKRIARDTPLGSTATLISLSFPRFVSAHIYRFSLSRFFIRSLLFAQVTPQCSRDKPSLSLPRGLNALERN